MSKTNTSAFISIAVALIATTIFYFFGLNREDDNSGTDRVSLTFAWDPGPENAFVYLGQDLGIFADWDISLDIQAVRGSRIVAQQLGGNQTDFGFISADFIVSSRLNNIPVVSLMSLYHESPVTIYTLANSGIDSLSHLEGKRLGIIGTSPVTPQARMMLSNSNVDLDAVTFIDPTYQSAQALLSGTVDAASDYTNYGPTLLEAQGVPIREFRAANSGVDIGGINIASNSEFVYANSDLVQRFVNAMAESLVAARNDPEAAFKALLNHITLPNEEALRIGLIKTDSLFFLSGYQPGAIVPEDWDKTQNTLLEMGVIDESMLLEVTSHFYNDSFINEFWSTAP